MRIVQFQTNVLPTIQECLDNMNNLLKSVQDSNIDLVMFGEMFTCPYDTANFYQHAKSDNGNSYRMFGAIAKKYNVYLVAGSIPEICDGKIFNTSYVFNRSGECIAKHRKVHLFDINITDGQYFMESDILTPGNEITVFDTEFGKIGLCICFDLRFSEMQIIMANMGAKIVLVPAAFNTNTGPKHWDLLFKARAIDCQCYYVGTSTSRDLNATYHAYGHSLVVSPWGDIINQLDESEGMLITDIDLSLVDKVRNELPVLSAKRYDLYTLELQVKDKISVGKKLIK